MVIHLSIMNLTGLYQSDLDLNPMVVIGAPGINLIPESKLNIHYYE